MALQLEAIQANDGDCLLLHYDTASGKPGLVLIDGGSTGVYSRFLRKRLEQLRGKAPVLDVRLAMVSHIDADHITGFVDLFKQLSEMVDDGETPPYKFRSLWHNSFEKLAGRNRAAAVELSIVGASLGGAVPAGLNDYTQAVVASVKQGNDLRRYASKLTSINRETNAELVSAPEKGRKTIKIDDGLTFTILGPHQTELDNLDASWKDSSKKKSAGASEESVAADYLNRTVPNLSSIVVMAESAGKRLLLTGDAGGDLILKGLESAGYLDAKGNIHVDLLKVQHHGSNHSVDIDYFRRVKADQYVISGNGKHGIPHPDTLNWLSQARTGEAYDAFLTNRTGDEGLTENMAKFLTAEQKKEPKHKYHFREDPALSITADLSR